MKKGNFRDDLYFRLNVVKLPIPPLRERKEDILPLFRFFVDRFNEQFKKRICQISEEAEERILSYPWPGNIRELRNAVERIVLLEKGDTILGRHLSFLDGREGHLRGSRFRSSRAFHPRASSWTTWRKSISSKLCRMKKGNKNQAAKLLGISRSALIYRMEKYGIKS